ncbi:hypothetical protein GCM10025858_30990 [Alicyclobacillus sacchari]|uniref:hypothetical protein n=1 Tax=Alicyclobacillus sacchari TaxID=392010 RepID=UPI0023EA144C|nr:hypothetical protein [Alicyclobacillus sacchari]GMA58596.1 hypothetical protein GCM10025858_30990 [Alicyclobacillus sacchari]
MYEKSVLEPFWRPVWDAVDKARVRKARQEAKAGAVVHAELLRGEIWAQVRISGPRRSCQVALPFLAHYEEHIEAVAKWLAMRPDWVAAHFAASGTRNLRRFSSLISLTYCPVTPLRISCGGVPSVHVMIPIRCVYMS